MADYRDPQVTDDNSGGGMGKWIGMLVGAILVLALLAWLLGWFGTTDLAEEEGVVDDAVVVTDEGGAIEGDAVVAPTEDAAVVPAEEDDLLIETTEGGGDMIELETNVEGGEDITATAGAAQTDVDAPALETETAVTEEVAPAATEGTEAAEAGTAPEATEAETLEIVTPELGDDVAPEADAAEIAGDDVETDEPITLDNNVTVVESE